MATFYDDRESELVEEIRKLTAERDHYKALAEAGEAMSHCISFNEFEERRKKYHQLKQNNRDL